MKLCLAYLTKNRADLTRQTFAPAAAGDHDTIWVDGSDDSAALQLFENATSKCKGSYTNIRGGPDAAIVFALTTMLRNPNYTHVGLCENDVLLPDDWSKRTMELFDEGTAAGLSVGAASARAYVDRVLLQRDGWAVMLNLGAGHVVFSREAARLVLDFYRTGWWSDTRSIFGQLCGVDIGQFACFRTSQQWTTADWHFDAVLAQHGLASLALTPSPVEMIGQDPPLAEQGLEIVCAPVAERRGDKAFKRFCANTAKIRSDAWRPQTITPVHRTAASGGTSLYFPHQLPARAIVTTGWRLQWQQGFGPFAFRAGERNSLISVPLVGPVGVIVSGGDKGGRVHVVDRDSGFEIVPVLNPGRDAVTLAVPGHGYLYRQVDIIADEGVVFHGLQTAEPQPLGATKFDYDSLPRV